MSHSTVMVTLTDKRDVDTQLAPFDENREMADYVKYTKQELIDNFKEDLIKYLHSDMYQEYLADPKKYKAGTTNEAHWLYISKEFPKRLKWSDKKIYAEAIKYYDDDEIDSDGAVHSTYNPHSKWDWYSVGGRWDGGLVLKDGSTCNQAYVKDIDFAESFTPFAILHKSVWHERGDMGWWGMVANEKNDKVWDKEARKLLGSLDPESEITLVDVHI